MTVGALKGGCIAWARFPTASAAINSTRTIQSVSMMALSDALSAVIQPSGLPEHRSHSDVPPAPGRTHCQLCVGKLHSILAQASGVLECTDPFEPFGEGHCAQNS